jgi:hypothetical protein
VQASKRVVAAVAAVGLSVVLGSSSATAAEPMVSSAPAVPVVPVAAAAVAPAPLPNRSGLPWASGLYTRGSSPTRTAAFAAWRGRPVDVVVDWSARQTWSDIVAPTWLYQAWAGTPYTKVFGVAPIPEGDNSTLQACAAGAYNQYWVQFGANIKAVGLDDEAIIRLGWEFNGNWYKWAATEPMTFRACWRNIYTSAESVAPALRWEWTVNRGGGQSIHDGRMAYPGDAYVDYVGVDSYDAWPAATDEASWQLQYAAPLGLKFWADFAKVHHKGFSVPEWGVYPGTGNAGHNGGDNAFYIGKMEAFFRSLGSDLAYESYFNENAAYYAGSIFAPAQNPRAAAEYVKDLRP